MTPGTKSLTRIFLLLAFVVPGLVLMSCGDAEAEKKAKISKLQKAFDAARQEFAEKTEAYNTVRDKLEKVNRPYMAAVKSKNEARIAELKPGVDALTPEFTEAQNAFDNARRKFRDLKTQLEDLGVSTKPAGSAK